MNRHQPRARRHSHRRPHGHRRLSTLLRRGLCRARSYHEIYDRLQLVDVAYHLDQLDTAERDKTQRPPPANWGGRPRAAPPEAGRVRGGQGERPG